MDKSAIILAGGFSSRFGQDKGLMLLAGKPLIKHVLNVLHSMVDETIIVVSSKVQAENFAKVTGSNVRIVIDANDMQSPLIGALTGFEKANGEYSLLLPCDTPLVSRDILLLLLELRTNKNAVVPRWPNGYIEPLQAVYCTKPAIEAAKKTLNVGKADLRSVVNEMQAVRYISTLVLQQLDPKLRTFFNVNTPLDLKKAEFMFRQLKK
ncbi:MAG: molybdenum cofactor guanylyltransferase [Candidatus Bathyarchaeota archaeon]|nr:molybdenum cofactor guanylyltransferase [Candidatus Bathyarchaeota archaeon]